jgi:hypothetical protein
LDDADKAEKLLRNLAQRLERDWSGVACSILAALEANQNKISHGVLARQANAA